MSKAAARQAGWIKLYRKAVGNPLLAADYELFGLFMRLLLEAADRDCEVECGKIGARLKLRRGQLWTNERLLATRKADRFRIRRMLIKLRSADMIESTTIGRGGERRVIVVTIKKYGDYQSTSFDRKLSIDDNDLGTNNGNAPSAAPSIAPSAAPSIAPSPCTNFTNDSGNIDQASAVGRTIDRTVDRTNNGTVDRTNYRMKKTLKNHQKEESPLTPGASRQEDDQSTSIEGDQGSHQGRRASTRALGINPRALGTNPRAIAKRAAAAARSAKSGPWVPLVERAGRAVILANLLVKEFEAREGRIRPSAASNEERALAVIEGRADKLMVLHPRPWTADQCLAAMRERLGC